jgi:AcrR family transcriptional regulator
VDAQTGCENAQQSFVPPGTDDARGLERLLDTVDTYLAYVASQPPAGRAFLLMWGEAAAVHSPLRPIFAELEAGFREFLRALIADGVTDGSIRADIDPGAAAMGIMGQLRGIGLELMLDPEASSASTSREEDITMMRRALETSITELARRK